MADIITAGDSRLNGAIKKATSTLNNAFGNGEDLSGQESYRFLRAEELAFAYAKDALDGPTLSKDFLEIAQSIKKMRSSYLPIDFFKTPDGTFDASLADEIGEQESYENTFMRMLGMPSTANSRLASAEDLIYISNDGKVHINASAYEIEKEVLDQRNKERQNRGVIINNSIYNINNLTPEFLNTIKQAEESFDTGAVVAGDLTTSAEDENTIASEARITNIDNDLFKFSYLLLPAIQDERVSSCINESDKIIASPFSPVGGRVVNGNKVRPTLLESVIRIRLDRLSGTDTFYNSPNDDSSGELSITLSTGTEEIPVNTNSYGILESLIILRLRAAISGLAQRLSEDIDDAIEIFESIRIVPDDESYTDKSSGSKIEQDDRANNGRDAKPNGDNSDVEADTYKQILEDQLLLEDAIMSLLGDNSGVLDLQIQTQRNSSMHEAHLMSGLIGIINLPRRRIQKEINDRKEKRNQKIYPSNTSGRGG